VLFSISGSAAMHAVAEAARNVALRRRDTGIGDNA